MISEWNFVPEWGFHWEWKLEWLKQERNVVRLSCKQIQRNTWKLNDHILEWVILVSPYFCHEDKKEWRPLIYCVPTLAGGGTSFFGLYGYVPLDTVWFLGPYKSCIHFHCLAPWTGYLFGADKCKDWSWAVCLCGTNNFSKKLHDVSLKITYRNYICKTNDSGSWDKVSCLKQDSKMKDLPL